ncbi:MAG: RraA family protein [Limnochordia bacterium]|jgi:4-hydroxy-4-methyl-2-oxoglutarate aldolase
MDLTKVLYSGVIADILDEYNLRNQAMNTSIRPLGEEDVLAGEAFTILATDVYEIPARPYELILQTVDSVGEGQVVVATTNGSSAAGFWGELLTTRAMRKGSVGAVIDGLIRDSRVIKELGFPMFIRGYCPLDSKGRTDVIAYNVPIECGGVRVYPGDFIFADNDGVVVVPKGIKDEVIEKALAKVEAENQVRRELEAGKSVREVYDKYGIL